jgi:hypothetical protein
MMSNSARNVSVTPWRDCDDSVIGVVLHAFFNFAAFFLISSGVSASHFDSATISGLSSRPLP